MIGVMSQSVSQPSSEGPHIKKTQDPQSRDGRGRPKAAAAWAAPPIIIYNIIPKPSQSSEHVLLCRPHSPRALANSSFPKEHHLLLTIASQRIRLPTRPIGPGLAPPCAKLSPCSSRTELRRLPISDLAFPKPCAPHAAPSPLIVETTSRRPFARRVLPNAIFCAAALLPNPSLRPSLPPPRP